MRNVTRREFGGALAGAAGALLLPWKVEAGLSAEAVDSLELREEFPIPRQVVNEGVLYGRVCSTPTLKPYTREDGSPSTRLFFRLQTRRKEPFNCVAWGEVADDLWKRFGEVPEPPNVCLTGLLEIGSYKDKEGKRIDWINFVISQALVARARKEGS